MGQPETQITVLREGAPNRSHRRPRSFGSMGAGSLRIYVQAIPRKRSGICRSASWAWQSSGAAWFIFREPSADFRQSVRRRFETGARAHYGEPPTEGFGAVFRGNFGRDNEFFLLLKQGPGGYRFHRSEEVSCFLLMANH